VVIILSRNPIPLWLNFLRNCLDASVLFVIFSSDDILGTHRAQMRFLCSSWTKIACTAWFHYYDPETKQQSSQWKNVDSPRSKIDLLEFQCLKHPSYSPDLAPMNFAVFPYIKSFLRGMRFNKKLQFSFIVEFTR
jgi:hypothetical protein